MSNLAEQTTEEFIHHLKDVRTAKAQEMYDKREAFERRVMAMEADGSLDAALDAAGREEPFCGPAYPCCGRPVGDFHADDCPELKSRAERREREEKALLVRVEKKGDYVGHIRI